MSSTVRSDVARVLAALDAVNRHAALLATHAADVYLLAYERPVAGDSGGRSKRVDYALDEHGIAEARRLWHDLEDQARRSAQDLGRVQSSLKDLLTGPPARPLRGTTISRAEYREAIAAQRRRAERAGEPATAAIAEYEPARAAGQPQPGYPRTPEVAKPKGGSGERKRKGWRHE